jgi:hypothetical protein
MGHACRDVYALALAKNHFMALEFEFGDSAENKEVLPSFGVEVPCFARAWWYSLLYDTEVLVFEQVPSIAYLAPHVVFRVSS